MHVGPKSKHVQVAYEQEQLIGSIGLMHFFDTISQARVDQTMKLVQKLLLLSHGEKHEWPYFWSPCRNNNKLEVVPYPE